MLPFSSWHAFSLFLLLSTIFLIFSIFEKAWTSFIIPNNGIHWINSCKSNLDFGGGSDILDIFSDIDSKDDCLIFDWFWFLLVICLNFFIFIVELTLLPIEALNFLSRYALHHLIFKIPRISMSSCTMSMFDVILDCFDTCLTIFDEMHAEWYNFQTNLWCLLMALKNSSSMHPNSPLLWFDFVWHAMFLESS